jgi:hypothetical protein
MISINKAGTLKIIPISAKLSVDTKFEPRLFVRSIFGTAHKETEIDTTGGKNPIWNTSTLHFWTNGE